MEGRSKELVERNEELEELKEQWKQLAGELQSARD